MDEQGHGRPADREPRGFLPRAGTATAPWRRLRDWLSGDRASIDQQGLLAERTLMLAPRRTGRDDALSEGAAAGSHPDEAHR